MVHCFFEQSGVFKNEFKKMGIAARDYDILNDFNETDFIIDLFVEIEKAYNNDYSIFDNISTNDLIFAFYPCVRFEDQIMVHFRGQCCTMNNWSLEKKINYSFQLHQELSYYYEMLSKLCIVCLKRNIKLIIENPYSPQHYLKNYWCLAAQIIDKDRTLNGDYFKKPTQYFFINCEPKNNFIFEPLEYIDLKKISNLKLSRKERKIFRSLIHPQYANRFIRQYII